MRKNNRLLKNLAIGGIALCSSLGMVANVSAESTDVSAHLGTYTFYRLGDNGDHEFNIDLRAYGGYGTYSLKAFLKSPDNINLTDETTFTYVPVVVTYIGTNEYGDPMFEIGHDENVTSVDVDLSTVSGDSVLTEAIKVAIDNPGTVGTTTVTIPITSTGASSGEYVATAKAYGSQVTNETAEADNSVYSSTDKKVTVDFSYDDNTSVVYFQIVDANGKVISFPNTKFTVSNPGTAGTASITLDLSDVDLSEYDLSSYKVATLSYPIAGSTKNVKAIELEDGPAAAAVSYTKPGTPAVPDTNKPGSDSKPKSPNVPDTGIFGVSINLARADYLIAGIVGFSVVTIFALRFLHKQNRHSSKRRR